MVITDGYPLKGITSYTTYPSGSMKECMLEEYNEICMGNHRFIPRFKGPDERRKDNKAVSFYESGRVKSIALDERTEVLTPLGLIRAELITFYESGAIDSLFPLNGQIGFGWSLEDEEQLLEDMEFKLSIAEFTTKIIGVRFFGNGKLKSMILWPKKTIELKTPLGSYPVRIGFRLYEEGGLESFEPAVPITVATNIGTITAFDQNAVGMDADYNSVKFYKDGTLKSVSTNSDIVTNRISTRERMVIYQQIRLDMVSGEMVKVPVIITFDEGNVTIDNAVEKHISPIQDTKFLFLHDGSYVGKKCSPGSDCSGCGASCM